MRWLFSFVMLLSACSCLAIGLAPKKEAAPQVAEKEEEARTIVIVQVEGLDHAAVFLTKDTAVAWCKRHEVGCKGMQVRVSPVQE